jgi:hypothetical protein
LKSQYCRNTEIDISGCQGSRSVWRGQREVDVAIKRHIRYYFNNENAPAVIQYWSSAACHH